MFSVLNRPMLSLKKKTKKNRDEMTMVKQTLIYLTYEYTFFKTEP